MPHRYFIRLSFDGTRFHGWQYQPNGTSIQAVVNDALSVVLREKIQVTGAGRTDAGVHARVFFAHFDTAAELLENSAGHVLFHLNGYLPDAIAVQEILPVISEAHARFSAISRTYHYMISRRKDPFLTGFSYFYPGRLDIACMNRGAEILLQNHDFTSFAKVDSDAKTHVCHLSEAVWKEKDDMLIFTVTSDRFLRNMVRAMVGTLIELGRGKIGLEDLRTIIEMKNRSAAGYSVPAQGLFLADISYPGNLFIHAGTAGKPR